MLNVYLGYQISNFSGNILCNLVATQRSPSIDMDETARLLIYAQFQMENHAWIGFARELK